MSTRQIWTPLAEGNESVASWFESGLRFADRASRNLSSKRSRPRATAAADGGQYPYGYSAAGLRWRSVAIFRAGKAAHAQGVVLHEGTFAGTDGQSHAGLAFLARGAQAFPLMHDQRMFFALNYIHPRGVIPIPLLTS